MRFLGYTPASVKKIVPRKSEINHNTMKKNSEELNVYLSQVKKECCPKDLHETVINVLLKIQNSGYKTSLLKFARNHMDNLRKNGFKSICRFERLRKALKNPYIRNMKIILSIFFPYGHY